MAWCMGKIRQLQRQKLQSTISAMSTFTINDDSFTPEEVYSRLIHISAVHLCDLGLSLETATETVIRLMEPLVQACPNQGEAWKEIFPSATENSLQWILQLSSLFTASSAAIPDDNQDPTSNQRTTV